MSAHAGTLLDADSDDRIDAMFQALADRTRRDIVSRVVVTGLSVSELAASYDMSFAAVQKHVAVLERAGLVSKQRRGRTQVTHADVEAIRAVRGLLGELEVQWRERVDRIDDLLAEDGGAAASSPADSKGSSRSGATDTSHPPSHTESHC